MTNELPIAEIIAKAGGASKIAALCGVHRTTPYSWDRVPPLYALRVARAIGVPAGRVRPDVYGEIADDPKRI